MTFPCEKCGRCCRAVKCGLLKGNLCTIYEHRPDCCNVNKMTEVRGMDKKTAYAINKRACETLRRRL